MNNEKLEQCDNVRLPASWVPRYYPYSNRHEHSVCDKYVNYLEGNWLPEEVSTPGHELRSKTILLRGNNSILGLASLDDLYLRTVISVVPCWHARKEIGALMGTLPSMILTSLMN